MSNDPANESVDDTRLAAEADRPPTPEEEVAAERGAAEVDGEEVAKHAEEMYRRGANVRGEGEIDSVHPSDASPE